MALQVRTAEEPAVDRNGYGWHSPRGLRHFRPPRQSELRSDTGAPGGLSVARRNHHPAGSHPLLGLEKVPRRRHPHARKRWRLAGARRLDPQHSPAPPEAIHLDLRLPRQPAELGGNLEGPPRLVSFFV